MGTIKMLYRTFKGRCRVLNCGREVNRAVDRRRQSKAKFESRSNGVCVLKKSS